MLQAESSDKGSAFVQIKTKQFAAQIISTKYLQEPQNFEIKEMMQGMLLYRGNRLVRRLQGRFGELREQASTIASMMQEEMASADYTSEVRLGKRTFSERNATS